MRIVPAVGRELAEQQAEQRRLARAVRADQADAVAAHDRRAEVVTIGAIAAREAHVRASTTSRPERSASCAWSLHAAGALASRAALDAQRLERAHASFVPRAARLDPRADPHLLLRQLLVELRPLARLGGERGLLPLEVACRSRAPQSTRRPRSSSTMRVATRRRNARSCVTNSSVVPRSIEELLHPLDRVDVEMVGRLVEQEHVGLAHERAGEQRLALASARRVGERRVGVEPEVLEHRVDARLQLPRVGGVEHRDAGGRARAARRRVLRRRRDGSRRGSARADGRARPSPAATTSNVVPVDVVGNFLLEPRDA